MISPNQCPQAVVDAAERMFVANQPVYVTKNAIETIESIIQYCQHALKVQKDSLKKSK